MRPHRARPTKRSSKATARRASSDTNPSRRTVARCGPPAKCVSVEHDVVAALQRYQVMRRLPLAVMGGAIVFVLLWVLFLAPGAKTSVPSLSTTKGSLLHDPHGFLIIFLDSLTYAGVLFIVASGFTLIFGLMRVVNMAHGAFFLLAAFIAAHFQRSFVGAGGGGGRRGG